MTNIIFWLYIFFELLGMIVFIDVILSWLTIFQIQLRPKFISNILDPVYAFIKKNIPTTIWMMDFTPIIILIWISFFQWLLVVFFPEISKMIQLLGR